MLRTIVSRTVGGVGIVLILALLASTLVACTPPWWATTPEQRFYAVLDPILGESNGTEHIIAENYCEASEMYGRDFALQLNQSTAEALNFDKFELTAIIFAAEEVYC